MKTLHNKNYTVYLFYDGSIRIEADGHHLCLGLSDLETLLKKAKEYKNSIYYDEDAESNGLDTELGRRDFRLSWPDM